MAGLVFLAVGLAAAACSGGGGLDGGGQANLSPNCRQLYQALVGTWHAADGATEPGWRFPGTFSLSANWLYRSGDLQLAWGVAFSPPPAGGEEVCDGLMLLDATELPVITYGVELSGDLLVLENWNRRELYVRGPSGGGGTGGPTIPTLQVTALQFGNDLSIERDDHAGVYSGDDWNRAGHRFPILYPVGASVAIDVTGSVSGGAGTTPIALTGTLTGTTPGLQVTGSALVSGGSFTARVTSTLPDRVATLNGAMTWSLQVAGHTLPCGATENTIYVALTPTAALPPYETCVHIACRGAANARTAAEALAGVWREFSHPETPLYGKDRDGFGAADGRYFTYWHENQGVCNNLPMLVNPANAQGPAGNRFSDGQCGAWADLASATLAVHGIPSRKLELCGGSSASGLSVRIMVPCWDWLPDTLQPDYAFDPEACRPSPALQPCDTPCTSCGAVACNRVGIAGQMNPEPPAAFRNHFVVRLEDGQVLDPSYGRRADSELDHERSAVVGLYDPGTQRARRLDPARTQPEVHYHEQGGPCPPNTAFAGSEATHVPLTPSPEPARGSTLARVACPSDDAAVRELALARGSGARAWLAPGGKVAATPTWQVHGILPGPLAPEVMLGPEASFLFAMDPTGGARRHLEFVQQSPDGRTAATFCLQELLLGAAANPVILRDLHTPALLRAGDDVVVFAAGRNTLDDANATIGAARVASATWGRALGFEVGPGVDPAVVEHGGSTLCVARRLPPHRPLDAAAPLVCYSAGSWTGPWREVAPPVACDAIDVDLGIAQSGTLFLAVIAAGPEPVGPVIELFGAASASGPWFPVESGHRLPTRAADVGRRAGRVALAKDRSGWARELVAWNADGNEVVRLRLPN